MYTHSLLYVSSRFGLLYVWYGVSVFKLTV